MEHRIEYVAEKDGWCITTIPREPTRMRPLRESGAMNRPTILIGGGYDKQNEYDEWVEAL